MPALPSLFSKGRNKKAGPSKSSFSNYLRGEPSTSSLPPPASSPHVFRSSEVIDINDRNNGKYESLDFDGGKPIDENENDIINVEPRQLTPDLTPQLDIDISSPEGLSDWFASLKFRKSIVNVAEAGHTKEGGGGRLDEPARASPADGSTRSLNGKREAIATDDDDGNSFSASSSEDVIDNLRAMGPSHFGLMPGFDNFHRLDQSSHPYNRASTSPISIPSTSKNQNGPSAYKTSRPISTSDTLSSAMSGTTLARALLSNTFVLNENRASKYRSGVVGLTRSDSTTLPRLEHSSGGAYNDSFAIAPDAPPIPSNAELLYEPPRKTRTAQDWREKQARKVKRRSSTGSIAAKALPETPPASSSRPISALLSPGVEFDMNSFIQPTTPESRKPPSLPRSPLPPTPKLPYLTSEDSGSLKRDSLPDDYQEATQRFPLDSELLSPDLNLLSPAVSSEGPHSAKNLEDVLNYYSIPDSPDPQNGIIYRPIFSPISEESSSQLSPPTPYRNDKRESKRIPMPMGARSPSSSGSLRRSIARGDSLQGPRVYSSSRQNSLTAVAERPRSLTQAPSPTSTHSSGSFASAGSDLLLPPPPISTIFNRARSGSAPSPIIVVRDSKDVNAYKITVTPRLGESNTPSTEEGDRVSQEFPETPNLFSPILTGGDSSNASSSMPVVLEGVEISPMPSTPLSARLPRAHSPQSLAQQIMLNRAASATAGSSANKLRVTGIRSGSPSNRRLHDIPDTAVDEPSSPSPVKQDVLHQVNADNNISHFPPDVLVPSDELNEDPAITAVDLSRSPSRGPSLSQGSDSSSMYTPSSESTKSRMKSLPPIPVSPMPPSSPAALSFVSSSSNRSPASVATPPVLVSLPASTPTPEPVVTLAFVVPPIPPPPSTSPPPIPPHPIPSPSVQSITILPLVISPPTAPPPTILQDTPPTASQSAVSSPLIPQPSILAQPCSPPSSPTLSQKSKSTRGRLPLPALTITQGSSRTEHTVAVNGPTPTTGSESPVSALTHRRDGSSLATATAAATVADVPTQSQSSLQYKNDNFTGRDSDIFRGTSLGSPPPYYDAIKEAIGHNDHTPTTGFPGSNNFSFPPQNFTSPGPSTTTWSQSQDMRGHPLARESSINSQRSRARPPLPAGPRRPSQIQLMGNLHQFRDRSGSVSSVGSNLLMQAARSREREASPMFSPKFQTPPPKWRGYTMEAAKWTFTSAQLQAIVSRAIRQSAEASSIRLLRLEVLDSELPEEVRRLDALRTDIITRFKNMVKRRNALVSGLSMYVNGDEDGSLYAPRMIDDLKEVTVTLDKLTEELHSLDAQLAHLDSLTHIHAGSALAMALRKLNASFLKQVSENQALRTQIQTLEAERDEAWQQAEDLANDFDRMNDKVESISSKRSSRISAVRKSSVRVSKAGLRTPSQRISQLSSMGSASFGFVPRSPIPHSEIPPVPLLPKPRPSTISTDVPLKSSGALSPNNYTPTSETRALVEAQDELYAMLGITNPERPLRRSRSFAMLSGGSSAAGSSHPSLLPVAQSPNTPSRWRHSSLPGNSALVETYNAMAADRHAVLATIDMLSSSN